MNLTRRNNNNKSTNEIDSESMKQYCFTVR